jgi:enterobactin synthetase component D
MVLLPIDVTRSREDAAAFTRTSLANVLPGFVAHECIGVPNDVEALSEIPIPKRLAHAVTTRRAQYRAGRYCAAKALERLGVPMADRLVQTGQHGEPIWPTGFIGSISHDATLAVAATCAESDLIGIGLDIEDVIPESRLETVIQAMASPNEFRNLVHSTNIKRDSLATIMFSAKESIYKCLSSFLATYLDFQDAMIADIDEVHGTFYAELLHSLARRFVTSPLLKGYFAVFDQSKVLTAVIMRPDTST